MEAKEILQLMKGNNISIHDLLRADGCFAWTLWKQEDVQLAYEDYCSRNGLASDMLSDKEKESLFAEAMTNSGRQIEEYSCESGNEHLGAAIGELVDSYRKDIKIQ